MVGGNIISRNCPWRDTFIVRGITLSNEKRKATTTVQSLAIMADQDLIHHSRGLEYTKPGQRLKMTAGALLATWLLVMWLLISGEVGAAETSAQPGQPVPEQDSTEDSTEDSTGRTAESADS